MSKDIRLSNYKQRLKEQIKKDRNKKQAYLNKMQSK